mmetsp:Transcript_116969/g.330984  ORF Transcript_116969/g.330984 Transcript_116969/m.330984 type:complete len:588 (+) Transcript_116969:87-1850(+)
MFFTSVEMVGMEHLPKDGPVILIGNHNNQFVDGLILLTSCHREISFMIAQKSFDRPLVGFLAKAFHSIPVSRPQDSAFGGSGKVRYEGTNSLVGQGTKFQKEVLEGSQLRLGAAGPSLKVKAVLSDERLEFEPPEDLDAAGTEWSSYKIFPKVDQSVMYDKVYRRLKMGACLGIFPEGGSHDRTDILPLKAGVAIIALDAYRKHHIRVPIVPVGLNYFQGHKFGGRAVVEFGPAIHIDESIYTQHETDRRGATEALLQVISAAMRSVIVPTPDYHTLELIYMARRLYVRDGVKMSAEETNDLNRRFAVGVQKLSLMAADGEAAETRERAESGTSETGTVSSSARGDPTLQPEEFKAFKEMKAELEDYLFTLKKLGMKDHQVRQIGWWSMEDLVGRLLYLVVTLCLGAIPQLLINVPVIAFAGRLAVREQQKALKASDVKLAARDVLMSFKIIYCVVFIPILYLVYILILCFVCRWSATSIILASASAPLFAFFGMKASEQGVRNYKNLVPLIKRVMPESRRHQDMLPARRATLQRSLHALVKQFGPRLGNLYWQKDVDWTKELAEMEAIKTCLLQSAASPRASKKQE